MARSISCGRDLCSVSDLACVLEKCGEKGFDFISAPIVHPRFKREYLKLVSKRKSPVTRSDKVVKVTDWSSLVVAKLSPWIQLDSSDPVIRRNSEKAFFEEMNLAVHLSVSAILVPLRSMRCENLARCLNHILLQNHHHVFWIQVPMASGQFIPEDLDEAEVEQPDDPWEMWNKLRRLCVSTSKLAVALEVWSQPVTASLLDRWCGELVKLVVMPTSIFVPNKTGYPVLLPNIQAMLERFFKLKTQFLLTGANRVEYDIVTYWQYINYRYQNQPSASDIEVFSKGYEDYLQSPLQPLMDNLDSQTYDVFEKDPFKYLQYEKAIARALEVRVPEGKAESTVSVIMVVGAGRGPLVDASLKASELAQREVRVFAVEKNPGAVVTLVNRQLEEWGDRVTIVSSDMREWQAPEKADILVSELLGSFSDNELSPECLDGAQCFLKDGGISIPSSYTSFLAPLSSAKLHLEVSVLKDKDKAYPHANFETPYVVRLHNANVLAEPKACFAFHHPNHDSPVCNDRYISLEFEVKESSVLHGFSGYFDSVLYEDFHMSIHPQTHSKGMISWFPIFFPLRNPVYVESGSSIVFHIWRLSDKKKVWYEWGLTQPSVSEIHNPRGRSYWIGL